jgi:hypothetical protein
MLWRDLCDVVRIRRHLQTRATLFQSGHIGFNRFESIGVGTYGLASVGEGSLSCSEGFKFVRFRFGKAGSRVVSQFEILHP